MQVTVTTSYGGVRQTSATDIPRQSRTRISELMSSVPPSTADPSTILEQDDNTAPAASVCDNPHTESILHHAEDFQSPVASSVPLSSANPPPTPTPIPTLSQSTLPCASPPPLSPSTAEVRRLFDLLDDDHDGLVSHLELMRCLDLPPREANALVAEVKAQLYGRDAPNMSNRTALTFDEFHSVLMANPAACHSDHAGEQRQRQRMQQWYRTMFDAMDTQRRGRVSIEQLAKGLGVADVSELGWQGRNELDLEDFLSLLHSADTGQAKRALTRLLEDDLGMGTQLARLQPQDSPRSDASSAVEGAGRVVSDGDEKDERLYSEVYEALVAEDERLAKSKLLDILARLIDSMVLHPETHMFYLQVISSSSSCSPQKSFPSIKAVSMCWHVS